MRNVSCLADIQNAKASCGTGSGQKVEQHKCVSSWFLGRAQPIKLHTEHVLRYLDIAIVDTNCWQGFSSPTAWMNMHVWRKLVLAAQPLHTHAALLFKNSLSSS
jgi:hypothetical protein